MDIMEEPGKQRTKVELEEQGTNGAVGFTTVSISTGTEPADGSAPLSEAVRKQERVTHGGGKATPPRRGKGEFVRKVNRESAGAAFFLPAFWKRESTSLSARVSKRARSCLREEDTL
ncbi:hypothetical protein ROHU_003157 [Labeo rohita]|uniref:Uncharacterized protein n=1 Tax=Labeo rohita TaxID=84645 RepID=A0A498NWQ5_LABRO|nr:hypothetical protein ROHU_003157 [Labeo rohita]